MGGSSTPQVALRPRADLSSVRYRHLMDTPFSAHSAATGEDGTAPHPMPGGAESEGDGAATRRSFRTGNLFAFWLGVALLAVAISPFIHLGLAVADGAVRTEATATDCTPVSGTDHEGVATTGFECTYVFTADGVPGTATVVDDDTGQPRARRALWVMPSTGALVGDYTLLAWLIGPAGLLSLGLGVWGLVRERRHEIPLAGSVR